jgi:mono/diheme cytochrome c family protein
MFRYLAFTTIIFLSLGATVFTPKMLDTSPIATASSTPSATTRPVLRLDRPDPPPTQFPPTQADNGAQTYWGMCVDCHGDQGQGLSDEWRLTFPTEFQECWESGCHGSDFVENSFEIPQTGAPAIAGSNYQFRFSNAFELKTYILDKMPLSPPDSLTSEQAWDLTAFVLSLN